MNKIALYRKHRPTNFNNIVGQQFIVKTLTLSIEKDKTNHAYIFSGPRGTGKTSIAKIFAKTINCLNTKKGNSCEECNNCLLINKEEAIDIIELDAASNNGVSEVRTIIENIPFLPNALNKKVYIIDEAHMLTNSAWNALLKTIEEPPKHVMFIFATTEVNKIPLTILSRCQRYDFKKISFEDLNSLIVKVTKEEKIKITEEAIKKLIQLSDGGARDCLSLLDQSSSFSSGNITIESLSSLFGLIDQKKKLDFLTFLLDSNFESAFKLFEEFNSNGVDFEQLTEELIKILLDLLMYSKTNNEQLLKEVSVKDISNINASENKLNFFIDEFVKTNSEIKNFKNENLYYKILIQKLTRDNNKEKTPESNTTIQRNVLIEDLPPKKKRPTISSMFKTNTRKEVEEKPSKRPLNPYSKNFLSDIKEEEPNPLRDDFIKIFSNKNKDDSSSNNEILKTYLENNKIDKSLEILKDIIKISACSNNGMIIVFEYELLSKKFNELIKKNKELQDALNNIFNKAYVTIAITKEIGTEFLDYAKRNIIKSNIKDIENNLTYISSTIESTKPVEKKSLKEDLESIFKDDTN